MAFLAGVVAMTDDEDEFRDPVERRFDDGRARSPGLLGDGCGLRPDNDRTRGIRFGLSAPNPHSIFISNQSLNKK